MKKPFRFKQFEIYQDQTAMKVGTDGVLLGAWAQLQQGNRILDIGTGTGLIALMLAQRFNEATVDAVELDDNAYAQAKDNVLNSKFKERIQVHHSSIQDYSPTNTFDLIVSNPPFFITNERINFDARKQARQQETLTFQDLIAKTAKLLSANGSASFIIPFDLETYFLEIASHHNLYPSQITRVRGNETSDYKRILINLQRIQKEVVISTLTIELKRHIYTEQYINLTKDFYLKM